MYKFLVLGLVLLLACDTGYKQQEFWGEERGPLSSLQCWDYNNTLVINNREHYKDAWQHAQHYTKEDNSFIYHCTITPLKDSV